MGWDDKVTCDAFKGLGNARCGVEKKQSNHWFVIRTTKQVFECWPFEAVAVMDGMHPVCGQACVQRMLEQWMQESDAS